MDLSAEPGPSMERTNTWDRPPLNRTDTWDSPGSEAWASDPEPSVLRSDAPVFVPMSVVHEDESMEDGGSPDMLPNQAEAKPRGRTLLRSNTTPVAGGGSLLSSASDVDEANRQKVSLHRAQTVQLGASCGGRVAPKRAVSGESKKVKERLLHHDHDVGHGRGSSLPPTASESPNTESLHMRSFAPSWLTRTVSSVVSQEVHQIMKPATHALNRDARRQVRFVVAGLMGSGKSTLCRMLAHLLGGTWVNQDEFSHRGKGAKRAFLAEIQAVAQDARVPVLIVDKINTLRQHRRDIVEAMECGVSGDIIFVQFAHPSDSPGSLKNQQTLCLTRIRQRGSGHRTLMGNDPKLASILRLTAGGVEAMGEDELASFSAHFTVDMTLSPTQAVIELLADLDGHGFLGRFHLDDLVSWERLNEALREAQAAEKELAIMEDPVPQGHAHSHERHRYSAATPKKSAPIWIWTVDFDDESKSKIEGLWNGCARQAPALEPNVDMHVTLLYIGGGSDKEVARRHPHLLCPENVAKLRQELQSRVNTNVEIQIPSTIWDSRIAAAEVEGVQGICANVHPHVTLAYRRGVPPRMSNELLARRAANRDLDSGLEPWLNELGLHKYVPSAREWCLKEGAVSADEIVENAADFAHALEPDEDQRVRTKVILSGGSPGEAREVQKTPPLKLRGVVRARRRGE